MRPELKLVSGRLFRAGNQELLVGASAGGQFAGLEIGNQIRLQDGDWTVVGTFAGGNGSRESEVIADAQTVMSAYKLDSYNSVSVVQDRGDSFAALKAALARDSTLLVDVRTEPEYLATASSSVNRILQLITYSIGSIMALGALFGALNSMHSAVAARTVEIATLRAIGFASIAVAIAVLTEALLLALAGAVSGAAIAYAAFNGTTISTLGGAVWDSQLVYSLNITPSLVVVAMVLASGLGLLGGLFPAIHAARSNVADALHQQ
jgi:putative ABC transport system permease protein